MNSLVRALKEQSASVLLLGGVIVIVFVIGFGTSVAVVFITAESNGYFSLPICLKNDCVKEYLLSTDQAFAIAKATLDIGVAIATIGGIFVALLSYFTTSANTALTNHIEHLKVFADYLEVEILKRDRLSGNQIDTLYLYGKIFNKSRLGKTTVSHEFTRFIQKLNQLIGESNDRSVIGTPGGFSYKDHQRKIKDHMAEAGIVVYMAPRNDYFDMEDQLFSLLNRVSQSFCADGVVPSLTSRKYY